MQDHVENIRLVEMLKNPNHKDGFEEIQNLAQHWPCIKMELKSNRFHAERRNSILDQQEY